MTVFDDLARKILAQANPQSVADLAVCLSHGNGAMRIGTTNRGLLVLGNIAGAMPPDAENFRPVLTSVRLLDRPSRANVGSARFVGNVFRDSGRGLGADKPEGYEKTWAPAATRSLARVPIGGALGPVVATTPDIEDPENTYKWYDLAATPVGGIVYRISRDGTMLAFQRLTGAGANGEPDLWVRVIGGSSRDYGSPHEAVGGQSIELSPITDRARPLMYDPAIVKARPEPTTTSS